MLLRAFNVETDFGGSSGSDGNSIPLPRHSKGVTMWVTSRTIEMPRPRAGLFVYRLDFTRILCAVGRPHESFAWPQAGESIRSHAWPSAIHPSRLALPPPTSDPALTGRLSAPRMP